MNQVMETAGGNTKIARQCVKRVSHWAPLRSALGVFHFIWDAQVCENIERMELNGST